MDIYSSKLSYPLDIGVGAYLLILAVLSISGNLLVLIMAVKRASHMKPAELLSVSLAITDLGAAVSMYPLAAASAWNHHWIGGDVTCRYYAFMGFFFGVASLATLTVMAVIRFIVSTNLQSPKERVSKRNVKAAGGGHVALRLLWATFPFAGWGQVGREPFGLSCTLAWGRHAERPPRCRPSWSSMFSHEPGHPAIIIISCYAGIVLRLRMTFKSVKNCNHIPNTLKMQRRLILLRKGSAIAFIISMGFLGSWTPYGLVSMWSVYQDSASIPPLVSMLPCLFAKTSTVYNPLIYYAFSKTFKAQVRQMCCLCGRPTACHPTKGDKVTNTIYTVRELRKPSEPQPQPRLEPSMEEQVEERLPLEYK
ncbi:LOW QUALITY PROTEIN: opsin 8, group member b [Clupea harengus]|uniref:LOW QUALITY PROTEIN: opsin 8, group member b n=1 Tax=Clupea harengus TaxID=7950 RepID=A0A8M1KPV1_CLUHA|nr:LOW QUALITY PROTEIN: opsin 8, group member b [Clupea harengus]